MSRTPISACVISFNEEDRIADCLRSLAFCDELLVLDSGSTDRTRELAAAAGARVEVQAFLGHIAQKNRAVELARHRWILSLDCDERVSGELREQIIALQATGFEPWAGFEMPRRNRYLGRVVRHGLFWPDRKLRLFDRDQARWGGTDPHDKVLARGPIQRLTGPIDHDSYRSFHEHRLTVERFSRIAARALRQQGRRFRWRDLLLRPPFVFVKSVLLKAGFLDGWRGWLIAWMAARYDWLKYLRLRAAWRGRAVVEQGTPDRT
jgi:glycosyltransferase involved in cell wall biosynthesis